MATSWSGKLYVVDLGNGKHLVGIAMPAAVADTQVAVYDGRGPFPPTGFPEGMQVDDLAVWLAEKAKQGFKFTPGELEGL